MDMVRAKEQPLESHGEAPAHTRSSYNDWLAARLAQTSQIQSQLSALNPIDRTVVAEAVAEAIDDHVPYYGVLNTTNAPNPAVNEISQMSRDLVKTGFVNEKDVQAIEFRMVNSKTASDFEHRVDELITYAEKEAQTHIPSRVTAIHVDNTITLNEKGQDVIQIEGDKAINVAFLHELGHGVKHPLGVRELVTHGTEPAKVVQAYKDKEQDLSGGDTGLVHIDSPNPLLSKEGILRLSGPTADASQQWVTLSGEMYADAFAVLAELQLKGKEAALKINDSLITSRENEALSVLKPLQKAREDAIPVNTGYVDNHHTTPALLALKEKIESGALDNKHLTPDERDKIIGEVVAKGLTEEYAKVRMAELNVYHAEGGKFVPGLPKGVSEKDVLKADLANPITVPPYGKTLALPESAQQDKALKNLLPVFGAREITESSGASAEHTLTVVPVPRELTEFPVKMDKLLKIEAHPDGLDTLVKNLETSVHTQNNVQRPGREAPEQKDQPQEPAAEMVM